MKHYLVTLTPMGKFFFGGDMTFQVGKDEKEGFNVKYSSYIIESNKFPQQTSLLGMMRYLLLSADETAFDKKVRKVKDPVRAGVLIGASSFSVSDKHEKNKYGKIDNIGPCFLQKREPEKVVSLLPIPKGNNLDVVARSEKLDCIYNGKPIDLPIVTNYDPKEYCETKYWVNGTPVSENEIFVEDVRIGIEKDYTGICKDKAFYKQISYRLADKYSFAFSVDVADDIDLSMQNGCVVNVGADSSCFVFHAEEKQNEALTYPDEQKSTEEYDKVVLLSDAYLETEALELVDFAITETVPFRFLKTTIHTENYNIQSRDVCRSTEKYYLYQRGSVFYFKSGTSKNDDFIKQLKQMSEFYQIGYNHYTEIKIKD